MNLRPLFAVGAAAVLLSLPAAPAPAASSFGTVVARVETALHAHPEHAALLGTALFFVRVAHPHKASGLHLALFAAPAGLDLDQLAATAVDASWSQLVRDDDRRAHERSLVYIRPQGRAFQLLVLNLDGGGRELSLVTVRVRPDQIAEQTDQHRHASPSVKPLPPNPV